MYSTHELLNPNLEAEMGSAVLHTSTLRYRLMVKHHHCFSQYNGGQTTIACQQLRFELNIK